MPVALSQMRELLLPGLYHVYGRGCYGEPLRESFKVTKEIVAANVMNTAIPAALPELSLPVAVAMGAAAVVISNPTVSRRELFGC